MNPTFRSVHRPHAPSGSPPLVPSNAPRLPQLATIGDDVEARLFIEPRTGWAIATSVIVAVVFCLVLLITLYGALIGLVGLVLEYFARRRARAILTGSALRVGTHQFPEIHACVTDYVKRLSLSEAPEVYVIDAGEVNGFALRLGRKNGIFLTDEAVAACLEGRSTGALSFVIAHELAHIALGHQRWWRMKITRLWLSRLDECSADNVACELVGSREAAQDGVILLAAGPRLLPFVDRAAACAQAEEVARDPMTKRAERTLTHPLTMRRLSRVTKRFGDATSLRQAA